MPLFSDLLYSFMTAYHWIINWFYKSDIYLFTALCKILSAYLLFSLCRQESMHYNKHVKQLNRKTEPYGWLWKNRSVNEFWKKEAI